MTADPKRVKAFLAGLSAEDQAREVLEAAGFDLQAQRYKTRYGEIDLIMRRDDLVVFVEVKARPSLHEGLHSITSKAQKRIAEGASLWIARNQSILPANCDFRFDVAVVTLDGYVEIIEHAFEAEG